MCGCLCVFIKLLVAARGRNSHYSNTVKTPLLVFYLMEYILRHLYGNERTCTIFLFYVDEVFCLSHYGAHHRKQSKFLTMAGSRNANWKPHYTFIPDCREQRQDKWGCDYREELFQRQLPYPFIPQEHSVIGLHWQQTIGLSSAGVLEPLHRGKWAQTWCTQHPQIILFASFICF